MPRSTGRPVTTTDTAPERSSVLTVEPMRRRHLRAVSRIEVATNPHPWSQDLFAGELRQPATRTYLVARRGHRLVGYAGAMHVVGDSHVTNVAVDAAHRRQGVASRLLVPLFRDAIAAGSTALTLEVRASNAAAQALYRRFGFAPAGVRARYYADNAEDALIMWADDVDTPAYAARLADIERELDEGGTSR